MANYLYNGVELPALPEWDKTTYPYAVISRHGVLASQYKYYLRAFKEPPTMSSTTVSAYSQFNLDAGEIYLLSTCDYNNPTEWSEITENVAEPVDNNDFATILTGSKLIWSTFDIMCGDTVVFAKNGDLPETEDETESPWSNSDIYKRVNGAWVKQDTYKRVNGQWVKQDEHLYS